MFNKILGLLKPIQIWIQRRGYIEPRFTREEIEHMISLIRPGYGLLSYESGRWTSALIPGDLDHVAGVDIELEVVESVGDNWVEEETVTLWRRIKTWLKLAPPIKRQNLGGVRKMGLHEWLWRKNEIVIFAYPDPEASLKIAGQYEQYLERDYDYEFDEENDKLSCAELVKKAFAAVIKGFMSDIKLPKPVDFLKTKELIIIYDTRKVKND